MPAGIQERLDEGLARKYKVTKAVSLFHQSDCNNEFDSLHRAGDAAWGRRSLSSHGGFAGDENPKPGSFMKTSSTAAPSVHTVKAFGEQPGFKPGDPIRISVRYPVGHYRVPRYIRGKTGVVEAVIKRALLNNEEEGFGRNAGSPGYYYRVAIPLAELWPGYSGSARDGLRIEVFETWLEKM
jgi:nitrile hydratase subunit beta